MKKWLNKLGYAFRGGCMKLLLCLLYLLYPVFLVLEWIEYKRGERATDGWCKEYWEACRQRVPYIPKRKRKEKAS